MLKQSNLIGCLKCQRFLRDALKKISQWEVFSIEIQFTLMALIKLTDLCINFIVSSVIKYNSNQQEVFY